MSQKNDTPALILSLLVTLALIGGGLWWFANRFGAGQPLPTNPAQAPNANSDPNNSLSLKDRLSLGEKLLVVEGASTDKKNGVAAIAAQNWSGAIASFQAALQSDRNDPESLIYLNNAKIGAQTAYTIAVSVPATESINPALEILRGVAQAQSQVNQAGGINGTPLKVLIVNDDNDPNTSKEVATALVQDASVLGVIGHFGSDATLAAGAIYQKGGLVMISPTSTSVQISSLGNAVYRTVPSDRFTASALSRYMLNTLQKQNAAVYYNSASSYSKSLKEEFTTALTSDGGAIAAEYDLASPAFRAAESVEQALQQGAQVLVLAANTATLTPALEVIAANRQRLQVLGGDSLYTPKVLQTGESAAGMVVAVPWILLSNPNAPFAQESRQLWGGDVNWRTAMAYDAAMTLVEGLKSGGDRQAVLQTIARPGFSFQGATGTVKFLPSGDRNQPMQLVVIQAGGRSGYGYDFVPAP
ncbi:MAG: ABC transporter substrate-binding protein [Timaviella obliquedivisa GSE-PSE-MK23-08B]|jgi:branched-chain amino acid transport system substrate-binding protein|nr:ABC transporter substrate-binding protein [Timaviella obliquedivisa GSE-PSE-MK23-08B]